MRLVTVRHAVKTHWCATCRKAIYAGQAYDRIFFTRHDDIMPMTTLKRCAGCRR